MFSNIILASSPSAFLLRIPHNKYRRRVREQFQKSLILHILVQVSDHHGPVFQFLWVFNFIGFRHHLLVELFYKSQFNTIQCFIIMLLCCFQFKDDSQPYSRWREHSIRIFPDIYRTESLYTWGDRSIGLPPRMLPGKNFKCYECRYLESYWSHIAPLKCHLVSFQIAYIVDTSMMGPQHPQKTEIEWTL